MKYTRRWLIPANFVITTCLVLVPIQGQGAPAGATELQRYGAVDVRQLPPPGHYTNKLNPHMFFVSNPAAFHSKKAEAESGFSSNSPAAPGPATPSGISVGPGAGFAGMSLADSTLGAVPPDTQVAAGAGFVVETVNTNIRIWNMNVSPPAVTNVDLISFFGISSFAILFGDVISDPRIRFDPAQQRWYISCVTIEQAFVNPPQGDFRLAVSTSSDPTQPFTLYAATTIGSFPDYPHLGFNEDKLILTGNSYALPIVSNGQFLGTEFMVANKADLMNPAITKPRITFFGAPQGLDTIEPADSLSSTCSGGVCTMFMAAVPDASLPPPANILRIWSVQGVPGVGSGVILATTDLSISLLSIPPGAVQQGSANLIETNDARLLDAIYRNGSLWVSSNTGCTPAGDTMTRACLHFGQVNTATMSLAQDFIFGTPGMYYYYPAIQTDSSNNLVAVFNQSSSTEYPSIYVSGQPAGAAPATLVTPVVVLEGQFPLTPSSATFNRWGDYSGAALDPSGTIVWVAGQYVHSASNDDWGTYIAPVQFSGSGPASTTTTVGSSLNPSTYGQSVTLTSTVTSGAGIPAGNVTFKDGATSLGVGTLDTGGQVTLGTSSLSAGPHSITAVYAGNGSFAGSTSTILTQTVNQAGTTTGLSSNLNQSTYGQSVTFTAMVTSGAGIPAGNVTFKDGATSLGVGTLNASGQATFGTSSLSAGPHSITAVYTGGGNFVGSTSTTLTQTVNQAGTSTGLSSSPNPSRSKQSVTFSAAVTNTSGTGATPAGTVTFKDGTATLATRTLNPSGLATFSTSNLSVGSHSITAVYAGTTNFITSPSLILTQVVNRH